MMKVRRTFLSLFINTPLVPYISLGLILQDSLRIDLHVIVVWEIVLRNLRKLLFLDHFFAIFFGTSKARTPIKIKNKPQRLALMLFPLSVINHHAPSNIFSQLPLCFSNSSAVGMNWRILLSFLGSPFFLGLDNHAACSPAIRLPISELWKI